jgi:hypothetical protein
MRQYSLSIKVSCGLGAVLTAASLFGGCGSGDGSGASAEITVETGSLSKPEFVKRADEMCRKSKAQALREFQAFAKKNQPSARQAPQEKEEEQLTEVVDTILVPIYEKLINRLSALGAPEGDRQEVAAFLSSVRRTLDRLEQNPATLDTLRNPFKPAGERALKYGLKGCGESLS